MTLFFVTWFFGLLLGVCENEMWRNDSSIQPLVYVRYPDLTFLVGFQIWWNLFFMMLSFDELGNMELQLDSIIDLLAVS